MSSRHVPEKCVQCNFLDIPQKGYPRIRINLLLGSRRVEEKPIFDTGNPHDICFFSEEKFNEIYRFLRLEEKLMKKIKKKILKTVSAIGGIKLNEDNISNALYIEFCLPNDISSGIRRKAIGCAIKTKWDMLIGLENLRQCYILAGNTSEEDSLEISLLPNKGYGYICKGVKDVTCPK